jgi:rSAM/selenodomain-associated transferase 1
MNRPVDPPNGVREPRVAVAIMAKRPEVGRTKTRLSPPLTAEQATALYEALLRDTIQLVGQLDGAQMAVAVTPPDAISYFRPISPANVMLLPVGGRDIGECLDQVLSRLLSQGFRGAVAVNSDGPSLPLDYLARAVDLVEETDVVLGPCDDGGYYLIGLRQPQPGLFLGVEWSTSRVAAQTLERAESLGLRVVQLPQWYDVDTAEDIERFRADLARLPPSALRHSRRLAWL